LSVTALFSEGIFKIHDARELRGKETDRITAIVQNLRLLDAKLKSTKMDFLLKVTRNIPEISYSAMEIIE